MPGAAASQVSKHADPSSPTMSKSLSLSFDSSKSDEDMQGNSLIFAMQRQLNIREEKSGGMSKASMAEKMVTFCDKLKEVTSGVPIASQISGVLLTIAKFVKNVYANEELVEDLTSRIAVFQGPLVEYFRRLGPSAAEHATAAALASFLGAIRDAQDLIEKFSGECKSIMDKVRAFAAKVTEHGKAFEDAHASLQRAASDLQLGIALAPPPQRSFVDTILRKESSRCNAMLQTVLDGVQEIRHMQNTMSTKMDVMSQKLNAIAFSVNNGVQNKWKTIPRGDVRLHVDQVLGVGSQAIVIAATWNKQTVCVKMAKPDVLSDDARVEEIYREAAILSSYTHPNIVAFHGVCDEDGQLWLIEELAACSVADLLASGTRFTLIEALRGAEGLLKALLYLHTRGVLHRDIKSANIVVASDGACKLADFGKAKVSHATSQAATVYEGGSVAYTAPEVLRGARMTSAADMYSFGVSLWEMATGQMAWGKDINNPSLIGKIIEGASPDDDNIVEDVHLKSMIRSCLSPVASHRPTAEDLLREVQRVLHQKLSGAEGSTSSPQTVDNNECTTMTVSLFQKLSPYQLQSYLLRKVGNHEPVSDDIVRYIVDNGYTGDMILDDDFLVEVQSKTRVLDRKRLAERLQDIRKAETAATPPRSTDDDEAIAEAVWRDDDTATTAGLWGDAFIALQGEALYDLLKRCGVATSIVSVIRSTKCKATELLDRDVLEDIIKDQGTLLHQKKALAVVQQIKDKAVSLSMIDDTGISSECRATDSATGLALLRRIASLTSAMVPAASLRDVPLALSELGALVLAQPKASQQNMLLPFFNAVRQYFEVIDPPLTGCVPGPSFLRVLTDAVAACDDEPSFVDGACTALAARLQSTVRGRNANVFTTLCMNHGPLRNVIRNQAKRLVRSESSKRVTMQCLIKLHCARIEKVILLGREYLSTMDLAVEYIQSFPDDDLIYPWLTIHREMKSKRVTVLGVSYTRAQLASEIVKRFPEHGIAWSSVCNVVLLEPPEAWFVDAPEGRMSVADCLKRAYSMLPPEDSLVYHHTYVLLDKTNETLNLGGVEYDANAAARASLERNPFSPAMWTIVKGDAMPVVRGRRMTRRECLIRALTLDEEFYFAWHTLAAVELKNSAEVVTVSGRSFTQQDCYAKAIETKPEVAATWLALGKALGLKDTVTLHVHGEDISNLGQISLLERGLSMCKPAERKKQTWAWIALGKALRAATAQQATIDGKSYKSVDCFSEAAECSLVNSAAWSAIGNALQDDECLLVTASTKSDGIRLSKLDCMRGVGSQWKNAFDWCTIASLMKNDGLREITIEPPISSESIVAPVTLTLWEVVEKAVQLLPTSRGVWARCAAALPLNEDAPKPMQSKTGEVLFPQDILLRGAELNADVPSLSQMLALRLFQKDIPSITFRGATRTVLEVLAPTMKRAAPATDLNAQLWLICGSLLVRNANKELSSFPSVDIEGKPMDSRECFLRAVACANPMAEAFHCLALCTFGTATVEVCGEQLTSLQLFQKFIAAKGKDKIKKNVWEQVLQRLNDVSTTITVDGKPFARSDIEALMIATGA